MYTILSLKRIKISHWKHVFLNKDFYPESYSSPILHNRNQDTLVSPHQRRIKEVDIKYDRYKHSQNNRIRRTQKPTSPHRKIPYPSGSTNSSVTYIHVCYLTGWPPDRVTPDPTVRQKVQSHICVSPRHRVPNQIVPVQVTRKKGRPHPSNVEPSSSHWDKSHPDSQINRLVPVFVRHRVGFITTRTTSIKWTDKEIDPRVRTPPN